ncbi:MAG: hypothetical protein ACJ8GN_22685 [Longimicrobiaceae bacterium]
MTLLRPRLLSITLPLALSLAGASCTEPIAPPEPGNVLFEVEYINFAWARTWNGFVVDADGKVYAWDLSDTNRVPPQDDDGFSASVLEEKYAHHRRLVKAVSPLEASSMYARVGEAVAGTLTPPRGTCADAGIIRYSALLYEPAFGSYQRILLHQSGDVARTNTSPAARAIREWLADVVSAGPGFCEPDA